MQKLGPFMLPKLEARKMLSINKNSIDNLRTDKDSKLSTIQNSDVFDKDQLLRRTLYLKEINPDDKFSLITEAARDKQAPTLPHGESELKQ